MEKPEKRRVAVGVFCILAGAMLVLLVMAPAAARVSGRWTPHRYPSHDPAVLVVMVSDAASAPWSAVWRTLPVSHRAVVVVGFALSACGLGALIDGSLLAYRKRTPRPQ